MAIRFRKSIKLLPGVRLNLSKSGMSLTLGGKGLTFNLGKAGAYANVDLPEIEDMPAVQATVNKTQMRLVWKDRSATQRCQEYQTHIHAVAFRLLGELFAVLPGINQIILSAYSQRTNPRTGQIADDYLLSVQAGRDQWQQINFANLEAIDVVACFDLFETRRQMSRSGIPAPIEPFAR